MPLSKRTLDAIKNSHTKLDLGGNQIEDADAKDLAEALKVHTTLQILDLRVNRIGAAGIQALETVLRGNASLQELYLGSNKIGADGIQALAKVLKGNTILQKLDLRMNEMDDAGAEYLAEALKGNTTLRVLGLSINRISATGTQALGNALKVHTILHTLHLTPSSIDPKKVAEALQGTSVTKVIGLESAELTEVLEENIKFKQNIVIAFASNHKLCYDVVAYILGYLPLTPASGPSEKKDSYEGQTKAHDLALSSHALISTLESKGGKEWRGKRKEVREEERKKISERIEPLLQTIKDMTDYGEALKDKDSRKGQIAIDLAIELQARVDNFSKNKPDRAAFITFKPKFLRLLHSKDREMSRYRIAWGTLLANIAIALTGIGLIVLLGKLIHSKVTEDRTLFFFQKEKTTREEKIADIETKISSFFPG